MPSARPIPEECRETRRDPKIVLKEKHSQILFENPSRVEVEVITVDGCAIREGIRCDHLVLRQDPREEYFIELKGSHVQKAFDQLERSLRLLSAAAREKEPRHCIVVTTKMPRLASRVQTAKKHFRKRYGAVLSVESSPCQRRIS